MLASCTDMTVHMSQSCPCLQELTASTSTQRSLYHALQQNTLAGQCGVVETANACMCDAHAGVWLWPSQMCLGVTAKGISGPASLYSLKAPLGSMLPTECALCLLADIRQHHVNGHRHVSRVALEPRQQDCQSPFSPVLMICEQSYHHIAVAGHVLYLPCWTHVTMGLPSMSCHI